MKGIGQGVSNGPTCVYSCPHPWGHYTADDMAQFNANGIAIDGTMPCGCQAQTEEEARECEAWWEELIRIHDHREKPWGRCAACGFVLRQGRDCRCLPAWLT